MKTIQALNKVIFATSIIGAIVSAALLIYALATSHTNISKTQMTHEEYLDISNVWYTAITYNGYIEYFDSYEYTITWRETKEDGTSVEMFKVISLDTPPSQAIKMIESNKEAFTSNSFEVRKDS